MLSEEERKAKVDDYIDSKVGEVKEIEVVESVNGQQAKAAAAAAQQ